jgi:hypothetical protein
MAQLLRLLSNPNACSPTWERGSAEDCACIFGGSGRTGSIASRNCVVEVFQSSLLRSLPVRRPGSGECPDIRRLKWHCATTFSTLSVCPDSMLRTEAQPDRTAAVRDPYARWCGRGGAVRRPPIPIRTATAAKAADAAAQHTWSEGGTRTDTLLLMFGSLRPSMDKLRPAWILCSSASAERQQMSAKGGAND